MMTGCTMYQTDTVAGGCSFRTASSYSFGASSTSITFVLTITSSRAYSMLATFTGTASTLVIYTNGLSDCGNICDNINTCLGYSVNTSTLNACTLLSSYTVTGYNSASPITLFVFTTMKFMVVRKWDMSGVQNTSFTLPLYQSPAYCITNSNCRGFIACKDCQPVMCWFSMSLSTSSTNLVRDSFILAIASSRPYNVFTAFSGVQTVLFSYAYDISNCAKLCDNILK